MPSVRPTRPTSRWSGVRSSSVRSRRDAMRPISVPMPVAVTTARPPPLVTAVPLNTMLMRSPSATGSARVAASLTTGSLSPVNEASATVSDAVSTRRPSALMASPSRRTRTSPGTMSAAGMRTSPPSRTTLAVAAAIRCSAATASSALRSCTKPSTAFARTMAAITIASNGVPSAPSSAHATTDTITAASSR